MGPRTHGDLVNAHASDSPTARRAATDEHDAVVPSSATGIVLEDGTIVSHGRMALVALGLMATTIAVFAPAFNAEFILFDDPDYVANNMLVRGGLTWKGIRTAFSPHTIVAGNWHPLTLISHMLDVQCFGMSPRAHHATSVVMHASSAALLWLFLVYATRAVWPSFVVAALFAWHPLRAESVAWIAERKDVLSTLLAMLTLLAYLYYVGRPSWRRYALVGLLLGSGLLAKPMLVTMPLILLLIDFWPLRRFGPRGHSDQPPSIAYQSAGLWKLTFEKLPLLLLCLASGVMTLVAQRSQGAVASLERIPFTVRWINAFEVYWLYIGKTLWPVRLAPIYPLHGGHYAVEHGLLSFAALAAACLGVVVARRTWPHLMVGWFWYLIMLVPVVGFVQVGSARMADRYTYLPSIGLYILAVWSAERWSMRQRWWRLPLRGLTVGVLAVLAALTWRQVGLWHDTVTLFTHAVQVTEKNYSAYNTLGTGYLTRGELEKALEQFERSIELLPENASSHYNRGVTLSALRRYDEALAELRRAKSLGHRPAMCELAIGMTLLQMDRPDEAIKHLAEAVRDDPESYEALAALAQAAARLDRIGQAVENYRRALALRPDGVSAMASLARIFAMYPDARWRDRREALRLAEAAARRTGRTSLYVLDTLAAAYAENGKFRQAEAILQIALDRARTRLRQTPDDATLARRFETLTRHLAQVRREQPLREKPSEAPW